MGVDVVAWEGCDEVVEDAARLPFADASFDTVSFLAYLNHIPNRADALREAYRVLRPGGRLIVTMITPRLGRFIHLWRRPHDPDERERHIDPEHELLGMAPRGLLGLIERAGFTAVRRRRFVLGLNNLFLAERGAA